MNKELTAGSTLSHYRIVSKIGAGGMGEVYLAKDTTLDRKVALKILPAEVAANQERMRRFVQEAKAASALNHPNILTIYEIDQTDSGHFIAAEFIDGETLRELMRREPLKLNGVLDVAAQIASALSAAHAAGIVHRDIKPDNVMLRRDGLVKLLDFGLAKLTERLPPESVDTEARTSVKTDPGTVVGTAVYMSPEQARGIEVDARTDIFSLGVVVYEMVAGQLPFEGSTSREVLASILSEKEPQPLARYSREAPAELERIVAKGLRKNRDERYQTIKDLLLDLKSLKQELEFEKKLERSVPPKSPSAVDTSEQALAGTAMASTARATVPEPRLSILFHKRKIAIGAVALLIIVSVAGAYLYFTRAASSQINSIAVLPFVNESGDPELEYLSDGMTDSLIRSLSQVPNLYVKARSTVFRYKGKELDPRSLGRELGVQAVLTGRLTRRAEQITLGLELINVGDENVIWTDQYERKLADLASLQSEIGRDVSSKLSTKLSGADVAKLNKPQTADPVAYQLYLRGRYEAGKFTEDGYNKGIEYFNQAIARDPNFALAYDGLSFCYYANWYLPAKIIAEKGRAAATRALELDPNLPEAHASLATIAAWFHYDWETAEKGFRRAIEINPELGLARSYHGVMFASLGRFDQAIAETEKGVELEPFSAEINSMLGLVYFYSGRYEKAEGQFRKTIEIDPNFWYAHAHLARTIEKLGNREAAISMLEKASSMQGATAEPLMHLGRIYAASGRRADAEKMIDELKRPKWTIQMDGYEFAVIYAALGDKDTAFAYLDNEYARGSWWLNFAKVDPDLEPLRSDARFNELLRKLNLSN